MIHVSAAAVKNIKNVAEPKLMIEDRKDRIAELRRKLGSIKEYL